MTGINIDHILVPLDGSDYAEAVLPAARFFAQTVQSKLTLLHIVEKRPPVAVHGQHHLASQAEAEHYLAQIFTRGNIPRERLEQRVVAANSNQVAREIARQQSETKTGMTILCTHGRGGLNHLVSGSIAQRMCRLSHQPILLIHPEHPEFQPERLLIPIDGNAEHEHAIETALDLALRLQISLELLLVIPTPETVPTRLSPAGRMLPSLTREMLDMEEEEAKDYLTTKKNQICSRLENRVTGACLECDFSIRRGDPARIIMNSVQTTPNSLLVLGTHGRSGLQGFWEGSVANKIGNELRYPMLLVPVD